VSGRLPTRIESHRLHSVIVRGQANSYHLTDAMSLDVADFMWMEGATFPYRRVACVLVKATTPQLEDVFASVQEHPGERRLT